MPRPDTINYTRASAVITKLRWMIKHEKNPQIVLKAAAMLLEWEKHHALKKSRRGQGRKASQELRELAEQVLPKEADGTVEADTGGDIRPDLHFGLEDQA